MPDTARPAPADLDAAITRLAARWIDAAPTLLVAGSSLMVYSGFRFAEFAHQRGKAVLAINQGMTRADHLFALKVDADCGRVLQGLLDLAVAETGRRAH